MRAGPTMTESFAFDYRAQFGPELVRDSLMLYAMSDKELPWGMVATACYEVASAASRVALRLRTLSEITSADISSNVTDVLSGKRISLKDLNGALIHHQEIEVKVQPEMKAIDPIVQKNAPKPLKDQSKHTLKSMFVQSDDNKFEVSLKDFATALTAAINTQIHSDSKQVAVRKYRDS